MRLLYLLPLTIFAATSASAASRSTLNRCSDATRELRGATSMVYADRDVEPNEAQGAISHLNQHIERYNRAQRMLDSAGPWDANDPDLTECASLLKRTKAYIDSTTQKIQSAQAAAEKQGPVLELTKSPETRHAFFAMAAVLVNEKANAFDNLKPDQAKAMVELLAPVDAACQRAMPEAAKTAPTLPKQRSSTEHRAGGVTLPGNLTDRADWWCYVSAHRQDLATKALGNVYVLADRYGNHRMTFAEILKAGSTWKGATEGWVLDIARDEKPFLAGLKSAIGAWYAAFGVPVPAQPFPGLAEDIVKIREAVLAAAARNTVTPGPDHDKAMEAGAKAAAQKLYPKVTAPAAWMDAATWTIEQNALGIPLQRFRSGQVVYRVGADPWCVQRTFNYVEPHMGGGKYQRAPGANLLGGVTIVKCP